MAPCTRGRLIVLEGTDGAGKSTLWRSLSGALRDRGLDVLDLYEPGGCQFGEHVRAIVKGHVDVGEVGPRAEALLFAAARAQICEQVIAPALQDGRWVLLDRFIDSSLAYQGAGRQLGIGQVEALSAFASAGVTVDRVLLVRVSRQTALRRQGHDPDRAGADRMESAGDAFFDRVQDTFERLDQISPRPVRVVDGEGSPDQVLDIALEQIADLLP